MDVSVENLLFIDCSTQQFFIRNSVQITKEKFIMVLRIIKKSKSIEYFANLITVLQCDRH